VINFHASSCEQSGSVNSEGVYTMVA